MNQKLANKIEAADSSIGKLLKDQKFTIDYFQREYRWQEKHIKLLIEDLTTTFLKSYKEGDKRSAVANYQSYYLGPVVFSVNTDTGKKSIIDGQQRITSITLLLIYLTHLQKENPKKVKIVDLIFSERYDEKSFNMSDEGRESCLKALFEEGDYEVKESDDETVQNMVERYADIDQSFPDEINEISLPFFIDWLIENVVIVEITAYSDENAYTIFETMNDRGLNLTPTEMLKGYVLSKISDKKQRTEINDLWKVEIQKLHENGDTKDQSFFQAWFRGKYAVSIRPGKAGSENQDFELIGRFHSWFKDNHKELFKLSTSDEFYQFFKIQFPFFVKWYIECLKGQSAYQKDAPHLNYIHHWGIAESLQEPLLLAPINFGDNDITIKRKLDFVSRYIETFTVRRSCNYRKFGQTTIKYSMFNVIKQIRNNGIDILGTNLIDEIEQMPEKWDAILKFGLHGMNRKFVKHLLSRISSFVDNLSGKTEVSYINYHHPNGRQYEIEHIWANKFEEHLDEFEQKNDFQAWRNYIGALLLLPQGTNQSFSSDKYIDKLEYYLKEHNTYAQTLNLAYYTKNPNFLTSEIVQKLDFKAHPQFKRDDIIDRQKLVQRVCEKLWSVDFFKQIH